MARKTRKTRKPTKPVSVGVISTAKHEERIENFDHNFKRSVLDSLNTNIAQYGTSLVAEAFKGSGDPGNIPLIDAELAFARARLDRDLLEVRRLLFNSPNLT